MNNTQNTIKTLRYEQVNVDDLAIPHDALIRHNTQYADDKLRSLLERYQIIQPLIVTEGSINTEGKYRYIIQDGCRRVRLYRELCLKSDFVKQNVPVKVISALPDELQAIRLNLNQSRERLSAMAELQCLHDLVIVRGIKQGEAAKMLGKSPAWCSEMSRIWQLPQNMQEDIAGGRLSISQGRVLAKYLDRMDILEMLYAQIQDGLLSFRKLAILGKLALTKNVKYATQYKLRCIKVGKKSLIKFSPYRYGKHIEIKLDIRDTLQDTINVLQKMLEEEQQEALSASYR